MQGQAVPLPFLPELWTGVATRRSNFFERLIWLWAWASPVWRSSYLNWVVAYFRTISAYSIWLQCLAPLWFAEQPLRVQRALRSQEPGFAKTPIGIRANG